MLIDTGCSSTVAGRTWAEQVVESLSTEMQKKVERCPSRKVFKFGSGVRHCSLGLWKIPLTIAGKNVMLQKDIVDMDLPCLLSRPALKRAGCTLLLENDQAIERRQGL